MKKITSFSIILIILVILGVVFFLFTRKTSLEKFYNLTLKDPLFYSPFFDSTEWEKSIKTLKDAEDELKKASLEVYPKAFPNATIAEKNDYISTLQGNDLFPYQFLKDLVSINQKTDELASVGNKEVENGKDVEAYDNGLKIEILEEGTGVGAKNGDVVSVHYTGTFEDGTKFDSSLDRGTPFSFKLGAGQVIEGWDLGVLGMKPGEKRKLTIPTELGYGPNGIPGAIPKNAVLVFEVELLSIGK